MRHVGGMDASFDAIAFAGGGNRCYWQGGFWEALNARAPQRPGRIVAVSAGAFQACFSVLDMGARVRRDVVAACAAIEKEVVWANLARGRSPFIVGALYRDLIEAMFGDDELRRLKAAPEILIQITRPPRLVPAGIAAYGAIGAYQVEKLAGRGVHSRAGRYLGLTTDWLSTHRLKTPKALADALMGTACVPPFMPIARIDGRPALDGGLTDNPPLLKVAEAEAEGGRALILATRFGRQPDDTANRVVVSPSEPIRASRFAVTDGAAILAAYELGLKDGDAFARRLIQR